MIHWVEGNGYSRDGFAHLGEPAIVPFAGRLPGIMPLFAPLYALFGESIAFPLMVILQFLIGSLSIYVLGLIAFRLFHDRGLAIGAMALYLFSYQVHIYEHAGATESLSIAFTLFSIYSYLVFRGKKKLFWLLIAGAFFAWSVALRPIMGSFGFVWLWMIWEMAPNSVRAKRLLVFAAPLALLLLSWNIRNYLTMDRLILLEDKWVISYPHEPEYGSDGMAIRQLICTWGGDMLYWTDGSMGNIMMGKHPTKTIKDGLPKRIYTPDYQADSLLLLRNHYFLANDLSRSDSVRSLHETQAQAMAHHFRKSYQQHHPFDAYIGAKIRLISKLIFGRVRHDLPFPPQPEIRPYQYLIKAGLIAWHYLLIVIGLAGLVVGMIRLKSHRRLLAVMPLLMIFVLGAVLGMIEERYTLPLYPFLIIYGLWLLRMTLFHFTPK